VQQVTRKPAASGLRAEAVRRDWRPWAGAIALLALVVAIVTPRIRRAAAAHRDVREIVNGGLHTFLARKKIDETALANEVSDRGDAYRALLSLLDAIQRERITPEEADVGQRARDLVESMVR
jgi:hypothetical protein